MGRFAHVAVVRRDQNETTEQVRSAAAPCGRLGPRRDPVRASLCKCQPAHQSQNERSQVVSHVSSSPEPSLNHSSSVSRADPLASEKNAHHKTTEPKPGIKHRRVETSLKDAATNEVSSRGLFEKCHGHRRVGAVAGQPSLWQQMDSPVLVKCLGHRSLETRARANRNCS